MLVILALQILNLSLNNLSGQPVYHSSAPQAYTNRIDCAFEFITENLLGWEDFVHENGGSQPHRQAGHLQKNMAVCWTIAPGRTELTAPKHEAGKKYPLTLYMLSLGFAGDINPPPPRLG